MSTTVLPQLAGESVATAERLVRLSSEQGMRPAEAEYVLAAGLAAVQRVRRLWPIVLGRIGAGMAGFTAQEHLTRLLDVVDMNLALAASLKEPSRLVCAELGREPELAGELAVAQQQVRAIRAEVLQLLQVVDASAPWPNQEQLRKARAEMDAGKRHTADQLRDALLAK